MTDELFQASTSQLSFEKFISTINQEQAKDLVRNINQFMKKFRSRPPDNETDSREVQDFLTSMEQAFARHPLWTGSTRTELDNAVEGLEKYLMTKLYDRTFGLDPLDQERDAVLSRRLAALAGFVTPAHLEVSEQLQGPLEAGEGGQVAAAQRELRKMSVYKSPRDKLVQILNCCKIINDFITSRRAGAGADDFTPTLIYVTIKAQPEALASNLAFIERYRHINRLNGEASYFFVQMQGAVAFLETLSPTSLAGCEPDEFIGHMLAAGAISEGELSPEQVAAQRRRAAAAAAAGAAAAPAPPQAAAAAPALALPPPPPPPPGVPPSPPVYGNPILAQRQMQLISQQPQGLPMGAVYGGGGGAPPPPPPPPVQQQQQLYYAGYPAAGPAAYGQAMPYYPQYGMYGQQWVAQGVPGAVPPPPPPPPSTPPPPPPHPPPQPQPQTSHFVPLPPKSVSELEKDGIRLVIKAEAAGELRAKYPYLYCTKDSLTLYDVSQLLVSYKELVLRYETLAQAVENNVVKYFTDLEAYQAGLRPEPPGTTSTAASKPSPPPPPSQPPPPLQPPQQQQQQQNDDLISMRYAQPPPPPPPPPPPQQEQQQQQHHYPSSGVAVPPPPAPPPPPPPSEPARHASLGVAGAHGGLDLSQYMPSYQLETEGYTYQAAMVQREAEAEAEPRATAAAATTAAAVPTGASTATLIDLLSDYTHPPPPPPSQSEGLRQQHEQSQPQQQQQQPVPAASASFIGEDDSDDKKLTPQGSAWNASAVELSAAEGPGGASAGGGGGGAVAPAQLAEALVASGGGGAAATAAVAMHAAAGQGGPEADADGAAAAALPAASLEATLSPLPPLSPAYGVRIEVPMPEEAVNAGVAAAAAVGAAPSPPAGPGPEPSSLDVQDSDAVTSVLSFEDPQSPLSPAPATSPTTELEAPAPTAPDVLPPPPLPPLPAESADAADVAGPVQLNSAEPAVTAAAPQIHEPAATSSDLWQAAAVAIPPVSLPLPPPPSPPPASAAVLGPSVPSDAGSGGGGGVGEPETEEERQARVDALVQQLLAAGGGGGSVEALGAELPVGVADDDAAASAAVDAALALYGAAAPAAPTEASGAPTAASGAPTAAPVAVESTSAASPSPSPLTSGGDVDSRAVTTTRASEPLAAGVPASNSGGGVETGPGASAPGPAHDATIADAGAMAAAGAAAASGERPGAAGGSGLERAGAGLGPEEDGGESLFGGLSVQPPPPPPS